MLKIIDNGIISHQKERGAYMPVITPLADGSFIACQHVGQGLGTPDNHIEVLRSIDGGATWVNEGSIHPGGVHRRTVGPTGVQRLARFRMVA